MRRGSPRTSGSARTTPSTCRRWPRCRACRTAMRSRTTSSTPCAIAQGVEEVVRDIIAVLHARQRGHRLQVEGVVLADPLVRGDPLLIVVFNRAPEREADEALRDPIAQADPYRAGVRRRRLERLDRVLQQRPAPLAEHVGRVLDRGAVAFLLDLLDLKFDRRKVL